MFSPGGTAVANYNVTRNFALTKGALLLSKSIGQPTHAGGAPFVNANSVAYQNLSALLPVLQGACPAPSPVPPPVSGAFWNGVGFADNATVLAKASILFASRKPTDAERQAVAAGGEAALRTTMLAMMQGPVFERFVHEVVETHFLPQGVTVFGNGIGLTSEDFASLTNILVTGTPENTYANRFRSSISYEGVELAKYIVRNNRPWTDMVAGNYTVMNGTIHRFVGATLEGAFTNPEDDTEWRRGTWASPRLGGTREHAGVLSTHAWLNRFPTSPSNRNRHRARILSKQFLATNLLSLAVRPSDENSAQFLVPWLENPGCKVCHDVMDPMAAGFQNWADPSNRYLPYRDGAGTDHALPGNYRNPSYPRDANGQAYYRLGDVWFRDSVAPGFNGIPMPGGYTGNKTALQWLGNQVATDPRFALGAVYFWYQGVFGREPLALPTNTSDPAYANLLSAYTTQNAELMEIATRFATDRGRGAYNVKELLADLLLSRWYRAQTVTGLTSARAFELHDVQPVMMLNPAHLQRKMVALLGRGYDPLRFPYEGVGLRYGEFDGRSRTQRANSYTTMQTSVIDRMVSQQVCTLTREDFLRPAVSRFLFPQVALTDTPATTAGAQAIVENIRFLHLSLLKEDLPANHPEVQATYKLFQDIWNDRNNAGILSSACTYNAGNDPNYTARTWMSVVAYLIGDPKFLFE